MSNYLIGISIGFDRVGYAVCDEEGRLLRWKGENLWGISRIRRGGIAKTEWIRRLQACFSSGASGIQAEFFESVDKGGHEKSDVMSLLSDTAAGRKALVRRYPTVYHLRRALADGQREPDARLVYLALHHLLKRGGSPETGIGIYEKHKEDLLLLKRLYRKYAPLRYAPMFRHTNPCANYVGYMAAPPSCTKQAFYDRVRTELGGFRRYEPDLLRCFTEMENAAFLPRAGELAFYEPPAAEEASRILENQSRFSPFLARERKAIEAICRGRREDWLLKRRKAAWECASRIVKEIAKARGAEPARIFVTYDAGYEDAAADFPSEFSDNSGCPVFLVGAAALAGFKRAAGLVDSRLVNDYDSAENAYAALCLGIDAVSGADGGGRSLETAESGRTGRHSVPAERMRRTFSYKSFFESGVPEAVCGSERGMRSPRSGRTVPDGGGGFERLLYDGAEYGVCASGELVCLTQIMLPERSLEQLASVINPQGNAPLCDAEYLALYAELLDKAERFSPFYRHTKSFSDMLRTWFAALPPAEKRKSLLSLLSGLRPGRLCGIFAETLPQDRTLRIDRSVSGMFEQKRKWEAT